MTIEVHRLKGLGIYVGYYRSIVFLAKLAGSNFFNWNSTTCGEIDSKTLSPPQSNHDILSFTNSQIRVGGYL